MTDSGRVTMRGGTVWGNVYGGFALTSGVNANYNTVAISGGTVEENLALDILKKQS